MKITKTEIKNIIKEELEEYAMAEEPPMDEPRRGRYDNLFEVGQPGNILAEAVAKQLMLDDESDFEALVRSIKDSLENWREYR
jgi:hypothetical protein